MLKITSKQEKIRQKLYNKNYQFHIYKITKLFLIRFLVSPRSRSRYLLNLYNVNFLFNSLTKTRSICMLTGRSRSVYRLFKMSRLAIRRYSKFGYFVGLSKASW